MIQDYTRQEDLINANRFNKKINIIGAGAIGSWLAFFLLKMGFSNINIYDFDVIEEHNIPNQLFKESQIGTAKVTAMEELYKDFFEETGRLTIRSIKINNHNAHALSGVVFSCVDSMSARKTIYENCYKTGNAELWIEGRIGLFGAYIYTLNNKNEDVLEKYETTLYDDDTAEVSACGVSQTALPSAVNCASMMLMQMISGERGNDITGKIEYSIPDLINLNELW